MKEMSKTKKIVAITSVIVAILIGTVGIYSLTKEHTPQFSLRDNKTISWNMVKNIQLMKWIY